MSIPKNVAQKTSSCAISMRTEPSILPSGGIINPAVPNAIANTNARNASFCFITRDPSPALPREGEFKSVMSAKEV